MYVIIMNNETLCCVGGSKEVFNFMEKSLPGNSLYIISCNLHTEQIVIIILIIPVWFGML